MNRIGIHYGAFVKQWTEDQFPLIRKAKALGFDLLEFGAPHLLQMSDEQLESFREEARHQGITLVISLGLGPDQDVSSPDETIREQGLAILRETIIRMSRVGARDCSGIVYGGWNVRIGEYEKKREYWERSVNSMKRIVPLLEEYDIYFNLEVVNRFENSLLNTCREASRYIEEVGSDHLGIHLDTFHMNIEEDSFVEAIHLAGSSLRYFHVGENNRKFPGLGNLPWKTIFSSLKTICYAGPITLEAFVIPGGEVGAAVSLNRELMDTSTYEEDLRASLSFIRGLLK